MQRIIATFLVAAVLSIGAPVTAQAKFHRPPCYSRRVQHIVPELGAQEVAIRVRHLLLCATTYFPVEGGWQEATCYAKRESSLWPWAVNSSGSGSTGLYQVIPSTWESWWNAYPRVRRWVARVTHGVPLQGKRLVAYANAMFSVRVLHDTEQPWAGGSYAC